MRTLQHYFKLWGKGTDTAVKFKRNYRVENICFSHLFNESAKLANLLKKKVKKKQAVILWGANSPEWVIVFFACVLQGVVVVPIDYGTPLSTVKKIVKETNAKLVFADKKQLNLPTVLFNDLYSLIKPLRPIKSFPKVSLNDTVEIVYTSGTTGDPKGVVLTHENLVSNMESVLQVLPLKDQSFLSLVPLSHMLGQSAMFVAFASSSSIAFVDLPSSRTVVNMLQRDKFTGLVCVPRMLHSLKKYVENDFPSLKYLHPLSIPLPSFLKFPLLHLHHRIDLRFFICGGAPLDVDLERWWDRAGIPVIQGYGLTETSPVISYNPPFRKVRGSVGEPLPGVDVALAIDGEICVKGRSVFSQYYKKPDKTSEVFSGGYFKTGDHGLLKGDFLFLKGRKKDMIVTPEGLNVYPEDVEQVLSKVNGVIDSAVVGYPKDLERVHAFLRLKQGISPKKVVEKANKSLSSSQQIQAFTVWPKAFPRTTMQKVQKFKLIEHLDDQRKDIKRESDDPFLSILSDVTSTSLDKIEKDTKLSELKLSSLDRIELVARLEQDLDADIEETAITGDTTVDQLSKMVSSKSRSKRHIRRWPNSVFAHFTRYVLQPFFALWVKYYCDISFKGLNNLNTDQALIVANHTSHLDVAMILLALPNKLRRMSAVAVWAEYFENIKSEWFKRTLQYYLGPFLVNGFLFPQKSGIRQAFDNAGELVDKGYSIILFPEGERTKTGKMNSFKPGVGLLAPALDIPIIPIKIDGLFDIWPRTGWKGPGKVTVKIGKPFSPKSKETLKITKEIEDKVRKL